MDEAALARELATAAQDDARRKAVDDMKKRSVLTARSYDEFRHLVACAEEGQRPVSSKEMAFLGEPGRREGFMHARDRAKPQNAGRRGGLGSSAREVLARARAAKAGRAAADTGTAQEALRRGQDDVPQSSQAFERMWRRTDLEDAEKLRLTLACRPAQIFRVEMGDLAGLLALLARGFREKLLPDADSPEKVTGFLTELIALPHFAFARDFLTPAERAEGAAVVAALAGDGMPGTNNPAAGSALQEAFGAASRS